ncbi:WAT1-related protein At5g40240-like [Andrographis paniculata]|uniref:WAT1-related protein At5g40240-like n=1 Tax=Andrographis paniculata TaxID=175694 RepID=UPI0021E7CF94|nr:WAT1-related protein At5g40240-like [Andrographis paniculata]
MKMEMEKAGPYVGIVVVQLAQAGLMIAGKVAMSHGMTTFTFAFYANALSSLLLLPICSIIYRSDRPPLLPSFLCGFFLLGSIGFLVQILGYSGLQYASATMSTSMLNLLPAFTFLFAVILRMEKFKLSSSTTQAKLIGTVVSIIGALVLTLYQGPTIFENPQHLNASSPTLLTPSSAWLLGGLLLAIDTIVSALFIIVQALVLKKCPAELILMLFYSCFVAILSAATSMVIEKNHDAWSLKDKTRLIPVIYSALFGNVFQVSIIMWCVKRRGPLFVSVFHPLGVIFAIAMGIILLGESMYLGSIVGSIVVVIGFYSVIWGKAKEAQQIHQKDIPSDNVAQKMPLLHHTDLTQSAL